MEEMSRGQRYCWMLLNRKQKRSVEGFENVPSGQKRNEVKFVDKEDVVVKEISTVRNKATYTNTHTKTKPN